MLRLRNRSSRVSKAESQVLFFGKDMVTAREDDLHRFSFGIKFVVLGSTCFLTPQLLLLLAAPLKLSVRDDAIPESTDLDCLEELFSEGP